MEVKTFFDKDTATFTYVLVDLNSAKCAVIDSVLNFNFYAGSISTGSIEQVANYITDNNLTLEWILETHAHADHITGAYYLREKLGGKIGIGSNIIEVIKFWQPMFDEQDIPLDGSQFDVLFADGQSFVIGDTIVNVKHTPGHTPACISYLIDDVAFVGDTVFMPHLGTARADFPGGSAELLYNSIKEILSLPDDTIIYVGHDYPQTSELADGKSTVKKQRQQNIMINDDITKDEYIAKRNARDKTLAVPKLLLPALQVNLRAGQLSKKSDNGISYLKIPLNQL